MDHNLYETLLCKIASREDIPPSQLTPPLNNVIDPEAIDALFTNTNSSTRSGGKLEFQYAGYNVSISATQDISIEEVAENSASTPSKETSSDCSTGDCV